MAQLQQIEDAGIPHSTRSIEMIRGLLRESDHYQNFEKILSLGVDSKTTDQNPTPLLGVAIESKLFHVVKFLMENDADGSATDTQGNTILHMLAKCNDVRIIGMVKNIWRKLKPDGVPPNIHWMPLNVNRHSPIGNSIYEHNEPVTRALLRELGPTAFKDQHVVHLAVKRNFIEGLKALISWQEEKMSSPSILISTSGMSKRTPLEVALEQRHSEALELLLATEDVRQNVKQNLNLVPSLATCGKLEMIEHVWEYLDGTQIKEYIRRMARGVELNGVLKYRPADRQTQYLRTHFMLAIANEMQLEAQLFLDYIEQHSPKKAEDLQNYYKTILLPSSQNVSGLLSASNPNTSPLAMSISKGMLILSNHLINLEGKFLMAIKEAEDKSKVLAHHASNTLDPTTLKICLEYENHSNTTMAHYCEQLTLRRTLCQRLPSLESKEHQHTVLRWHREWAIQAFELRTLHQVTDALSTLPVDQRKRVICSASTDHNSNGTISVGCLQHALSSQMRLFVNELIYQEYLCHEYDEIEGTKCIREQLRHENDIMYTSSMFSSFYSKSNWGKLGEFIVLNLLPCLLGVAFICVDIWQDMKLTEEYDSRRKLAINVETARKYNVAFIIGLTSQFSHLLASFPVWIWNCITYLRQPSTSYGSGNTKTILDAFVTAQVILTPIVIAVSSFTLGILSSSTELLLMRTSNAFSATLIICLSITRMVTTAKVVFGHDQQRSQNNAYLHLIERQLVMVTIGESCLEATFQLGLQAWLLSEESFTDPLKQSGFLRGSFQTMIAIFTTEQNVTPFQAWLLFKLFLSSASIITSVSKNYRRLRNNSVELQHLTFVYLSLICQILARVSTIINWCLQLNGSLAWQVGGVGAFLLINIGITIPIHARKRMAGVPGTVPDFQNVIALVLSILASSTLLVRIPQLNQGGQVVPEDTVLVQTFYFSTSLLTNILWTWMSFGLSDDPVQNGTMGEIIFLFFGGVLFHIIYYTIYGHPWKIIIRKSAWNKFKKVCPFFSIPFPKAKNLASN